MKNLSLIQFVDIFGIADNFSVDLVPLKHPETGEKVYFIGSAMMESWYRKKPGQAGKAGQMWPFMQGLGFDVKELEVHDDIKKELGGKVGNFTKKSSILSRA